MRSVSISKDTLLDIVSYLEMLLTLEYFMKLPENRRIIVKLLVQIEKALAR